MKRKEAYREVDDRIREVLRFERFYAPRLRAATRAAFVNEVNAAELGLLHELLPCPCTAAWLSWRLELDPGYLSRTLRKLEDIGLVTTCRSPGDGRMRQVSLTDWGHAAARYLEQFQEDRVRQALESLPRRQQERLVRAMAVIVEVLTRDELANVLECIREA